MNATAAMHRAIEISSIGLGKTKGNPIVGAVIFNESGIISEGFHQSGPHAEIVAINNAKVNLTNASIAVTLEPCNHYGKTPPCTEAIIQSGIKNIYYAVTDPNQVAAGGANKLQDAGLKVESGLLEKEAAFANRAWLNAIKKARPYFTWKVAITIDGKIAAKDGSSKWITNQDSRAFVAKLRSESDCILVGTGTLIADDPNLVPEGFDNRPLRAVIGNREIPGSAKVRDDRAELFHHQSRNLMALAAALHKREIRSVLVEAGPTLGSALINAGLIDELAVFTAPKLLGDGPNFLDSIGIDSIDKALQLAPIESKTFGTDTFTRYQFIKAGN
jgi:diaminohydroxyphosphoribosylaminopyrimidine deaminase/5-amino-6-(5-phosphoribosylamino)uracil reductase